MRRHTSWRLAAVLAALALVLLAATLPCVSAARLRDQITSLPGWHGALPSRMFSGYLPSNPEGTHQMHYWFVESEESPETAPVIVWYTGGPGGASIYGLMIEIGPLFLSGASLDVLPGAPPRLFYNKHTWSKHSNILIAGFPPPVGFSYCLEPGGCPRWNDTSAAVENAYFLRNFFAAFPEYAYNGVYLTGESYAGVYVPELVKQLLADPGPFELRGFALGDVCLGTASDGGCASVDWMYWTVVYMRGHEQFSAPLYDAIMATCGEATLRAGNYSLDPRCYALLMQMQAESGGYNRLDLYDECYVRPLASVETTRRVTRRALQRLHAGRTGNLAAKLLRPEWDDHTYPCGGETALAAWVNRSDVKHALHVPEWKTFWEAGSNWSGYVMSETDLKGWYQSMLKQDKLRVLIYNGDADPAVQAPGVEAWAQGLGLDVVESWRPWALHDNEAEVGGFVTTYAHNFSFATVRGAGHMVPLYRPESAHEMITRFVHNLPLRHYHGPFPSFQVPTDPFTTAAPYTTSPVSDNGGDDSSPATAAAAVEITPGRAKQDPASEDSAALRERIRTLETEAALLRAELNSCRAGSRALL